MKPLFAGRTASSLHSPVASPFIGESCATFDWLVVGAGFAGAVLAERLARVRGDRVLVVDRREHVGGNAYDHLDAAGVLVHRYGPHIFHTNSEAVFDYLSRFTAWHPYEHRVLGFVDGMLVPIPINLDTINQLYGLNLTSDELEHWFRARAEPVSNVRTSEDVIVSRIGRELYRKFFQNYTRKQWGLDPSELDRSVTARVPVRTNQDDRYFTDRFQAMPRDGYTRMFDRMLAHSNITVRTGADYDAIKGTVPFRRLIWTGPVDEFFGHRFGKLPYRSLRFRHETLRCERFQAVGTVNYPQTEDYTRITEYKHLTGQEHSWTSVTYEYPTADGDPYYPVPRPENQALYKRYEELAEAEPDIWFVGRLATYRYLNMDQVVGQALATFRRIEAQVPRSEGRGAGRRAGARQSVQCSVMRETGEAALELWGGLECSVVRIGDAWRDQVRETGHHDRGARDLDRVAALGIRTLRYPVLWERAARDQPDAPGWAWHDRQLEALRQRGITPVAGLVHHGAGPLGTDLLATSFPGRLAAHAGRAAARYPDVATWTPVNEPLTTARFACLYGHWHPHRRDEGAFLRAVVNQCFAILLSMRAIRARVPQARFLHTEDLGRVFSTPPLARQTDYENSRRWLSLDLLCGQVGRSHDWRANLERLGVPARHLDELSTGEAAPDLIGINHYATSDRYLDHRTHLYPPHLRGGNGALAYADTEAVRVDLGPGMIGWEPRLREAWTRYRLPLIVSEAHLGCDDPHEQVRWLLEAWNAAQLLRAEGADVRAVTAWALFGLVDWDTMLREREGRYEPGAFDAASHRLRSGSVRRGLSTAVVMPKVPSGWRMPNTEAASPFTSMLRLCS